MWAYEDGLDDMAAISDIEKAFGVTFTDDEWLRMYGGTLAELIDVLLLKAVR
jgi:acyl carrier protein